MSSVRFSSDVKCATEKYFAGFVEKEERMENNPLRSRPLCFVTLGNSSLLAEARPGKVVMASGTERTQRSSDEFPQTNDGENKALEFEIMVMES